MTCTLSPVYPSVRRRTAAPVIALLPVLFLTGAPSALGGLVSRFTFDDPIDPGRDSGPLAQHAVPGGDARRSDEARVGAGALALDGAGDFLRIPSGSAWSGLHLDGDGFTVAAWIRPDSLAGVRRIVSTDMSGGFVAAGWGCGSGGSSPMATTYGIHDFNADAEILTADVWNHVAFVFRPEAGEVDFFVDGAHVATVSGPDGSGVTEAPFLIGGLALPSSTQWFDGLIDDVRIHDDELTPETIAALAAGSSIPTIDSMHASPAPLVGPGTTALAWSVRNAERLVLDGGPFASLDVTGTDGITTPELTTDATFTLTAFQGVESAVASVIVAVVDAPPSPVISEFVALNESGLVDEDGDAVDWIEIHNPHGFHVDLGGWSLSDDPDDLRRWSFPSVLLAPGGRLVVLASGKDRRTWPAPLHTEFRLSGDGEFLALVRPDGSLADAHAPAFPPQVADIAFGLDEAPGPGAERATGYRLPTPGLPNGPALAGLPPIIADLTRDPPPPGPDESLLISAHVAPTGSPLSEVTLHYRIDFGAERTLPMRDDGEGGDAVADDGRFAAVIPASDYDAGEMIRWYVTAAIEGGQSRREPPFTDPLESAEYHGTVVVGDQDPGTQLPVLHWFVANERASETRSGTQASLFFDGRFYDNVYCRIRGQSAASWPKHKFKFDFYRGGRFTWSEDAPPVEEFNLQSHYREMFTQTSNTSYLREPMMFHFMNEVGAAAPAAFHLQVRRNGSFYGLFSFVEQIDDTFLERHGYDASGPLYKAAWQGGGPATLSPGPQPGQYRKALREDEPWDDFRAFCQGINRANPDRFLHVRDHVDVAQWINVMAAMNVPFNHDQLTKNYYVYLDPSTNEWHRFPWDADQSFPIGQYITGENWTSPLYGDASHTQELQGGSPNPQWQNHMHAAILDDPVTRSMYMRRVRTLADRHLAAAAPDTTTILVSGTPASTPLRFLVPSDDSLADGSWTDPGYDDDPWQRAAAGLGFEVFPGEYADLVATRVNPNEIAPGATTVLTRIAFLVDDPARFDFLTLRMKYDDGFVAFLNGAEVARSNLAGAGTPAWNATATSRGPDTLNLEFADFPLPSPSTALRPGANLLAIAAVNSSPQNSDMLVLPELVAGEASYFDNLVAEWKARIEPDAHADRAAWAAVGVSISDIDAGVREILETSLPRRRTQLFETYGPSGQGLVPEPQPADVSIEFGAIEPAPDGGDQNQEYVELVNPNAIAVDVSGWTVEGGISHRLQQGTVIPAGGSLHLSPDVRSFRARTDSPKAGEGHFVQGNYSGHLSSFGETLVLADDRGRVVATSTYEGEPSDAQRHLVISEILYAPGPAHPDAEFVELTNTSDAVTLDLSGVRFTRGIGFVFPSGFTLEPGARAVLVLDSAAFEAAHGAGIPVAGVFASGRLDNAGETLKLEDADGGTIMEFRYGGGLPWPPEADDAGFSIVRVPAPVTARPDSADLWRPSAVPGGSPGASDAAHFTGTPESDGDRDGVNAFAEHALARSDTTPDGAPLDVTLDPVGGTVSLTFSRNVRADDAAIHIEGSTALEQWLDLDAITELIHAENDGQGTRTETWQLDTSSLAAAFAQTGLRAVQFRLMIVRREG